MAIALIIAVCVVLVVIGAHVFDYLGKLALAGGDKAMAGRVEALERRLAELEQGALERDQTVHKLETELTFMTNLLESRSR